MILVDTGPLVALFDPADNWHEPCVARLRELREPLYTTIPVLTEAFHLLSPASLGAQKLMDFVAQRGLTVWFLADAHLDRAFELMSRYADCAMDLADASLVVAAEQLGTRKIFSIDRRDFATYRVKRGHRLIAFQLVGP